MLLASIAPIDHADAQSAKSSKSTAVDKPKKTAAKPARVNLLNVPFRNGDIYVRDIVVKIAGGEATEIGSKILLEILDGVLSPAALQRLRAHAESKREFISFKALKETDIPVTFDPGRVEVSLARDHPDIAPVKISMLDSRGRVDASKFKVPAPVSGFVNVVPRIEYIKDFENRSDSGRSPLSTEFDGGLSYGGHGGVAVQFLASFEGAASPRKWQRLETRLVHDRIEDATRITLGDVDYQIAGFQDFLSLGGVSLFREFDIEPDRVTQVTGRRSFVVKRDSEVSFYVNNRLIRTLRLRPGKYDLENLPFLDGGNDVQIVVRDRTGKEERIEYSAYSDSNLLDVGLSEYSLAAGLNAQAINGQIEYDEDRPAVTGFYRQGLTETFTAGINAQASAGPGQANIGFEAVKATPLGSFSGDAAITFADGRRPDMGLSLDFERDFRDDKGELANVLDLSLEVFGSEYVGSIGSEGSERPFNWELNGRIQHYLKDDWIAELSGTWTDRLPDDGYRRSLRFNMSKYFSNGHSLQATGEWSQEDDDKSRFAVFLSLVFRINEKQSVTYRIDGEQQSHAADWQYLGDAQVGGLDARVSTRSDKSTDLAGNVVYRANRTEANLSHDVSFSGNTPDRLQETTSLSLATALAFAGGSVTLGRPINDAFAIVSRAPTLAEKVVHIAPSPEGDTARLDLFDGLVGDLTPYQANILEFTVDDLPLGYHFEQSRLNLYPSYLSGIAVEIGSDAAVTLIGVFHDRAGKPVASTGGIARIIGDKDGDKDGEAMETFTNKSGRFVLAGIKPGVSLEVKIGEGRYLIQVPKDAEGLHKLGTLRPENGSK